MRGMIVALVIALVGPAAAEDAKPARKVVTSTSIDVLAPIAFAPGSAVVPPSSVPTIAAVADTLKGNPGILQVAVLAYTAANDGKTADARAELGMRRSRAVIALLASDGVAAGRLVAQTAPARVAAEERNVALVILKRAE